MFHKKNKTDYTKSKKLWEQHGTGVLKLFLYTYKCAGRFVDIGAKRDLKIWSDLL